MGCVINQDKMASRFITRNDLKTEMFVFNLPSHWWSRPYEYAWAATFAEKGDVALDAACGICHPFKFYLAEHCNEVHACDIDERILWPAEILKDVAREFGKDAADQLSIEFVNRVHYARCSTTSLPYEIEKFDKIYCISVLEHLTCSAKRSRHPLRTILATILGRVYSDDILLSLSEFQRVLKKNGLIILTFDYPRIDLEYFEKIVSKLGLAFAGGVSYELPPCALYSREQKLYCYRAMLRRSNNDYQQKSKSR